MIAGRLCTERVDIGKPRGHRLGPRTTAVIATENREGGDLDDWIFEATDYLFFD